jgi:hypothetical protein
MECELITRAKAKRLTPEAFRKETDVQEQILESDHFSVCVTRCRDCGQLIADCFREYTSPDFEDDCWTFWVPVTEQDVSGIKSAPILLKFIGELVHERPHICWHPDGHVYWSEKGFPLAFVVFLP